MRKGTQKVFEAWRNGKHLRKQESIWTNGRTIFSYQTPIVSTENCRTTFNARKYSVTTSTHQNGLRFLLDSHGYIIDSVTYD
jgi:hypothetical protein